MWVAYLKSGEVLNFNGRCNGVDVLGNTSYSFVEFDDDYENKKYKCLGVIPISNVRYILNLVVDEEEK